jgi:pimeloyl-ACP methyl ester carboxylesterase
MSRIRVPQFIPGYGQSYALLSNNSKIDRAAIFVHGFGGKPTSTWVDFHRLADEYCPEYPWWSTSDMFFYSYESLGTPIRHNAELLGDFVGRVWLDEWRDNFSIHSRRHYEDMILVGHSEGAVIIRRLILDRYEAIKQAVKAAHPTMEDNTLKTRMLEALGSDSLLTSHLRLFAPACRGTNFSSWVGFMTSLSHFLAAIASSSLVRNELRPDSPVLESLKTGTEKAHSDFPELSSLFTRPLFGVPDQIVISDSYAGEMLLWDVGYDHFAVCKPNYTHKRPLEFVDK